MRRPTYTNFPPDIARPARDTDNVFTRPHLRFIAEHLSSSVIVCTPFLTEAACREIVDITERHAAANGGWCRDPSHEYEQTTTDLEVDKV